MTLSLVGHEQLLAEDVLMRAADHYIHGQMRGSAAAIIVAEHSHRDLDDLTAWNLFLQLGQAVRDRIDSRSFGPLLRAANQRCDQLLHHLIHGTPPETPDAELLAVASAVGVVDRPLRLITSES